MSADAQMPRYSSHKEVRAFKIAAIEFEEDGSAKISPADGVRTQNGTVKTKPDFRRKFTGGEDDTGYYVLYKDGYESWSPTQAFEEGYTRIDA